MHAKGRRCGTKNNRKWTKVGGFEGILNIVGATSDFICVTLSFLCYVM